MSKEQSGRGALAAATAAAYLVIGLAGGLLGPALPMLADNWGVRLDAAGAIFSVTFVGECITIALSGALLDRVGRKPPLAIGMVMMGIGLSGIALAPTLLLALVGAFVMGAGWGAMNVTLNVFVSDLYPTRLNSALNSMNGAYGLGALIAPLALSAVVSLLGLPLWALLGVSVACVLTGLSFVPLIFPTQQVSSGSGSSGTFSTLMRDRHLLLIVIMFFIYVGTEVAFGGWVFSFGRQGARLDETAAALGVSAYWLAFTVGRLGAGVIARAVSGARIVLGGVVVAALGATVIMLFGGSALGLYAGALLVGLGMAPIFPTAFGLVAARYNSNVAAVSGLATLGGSLGGVVLPYMLGSLLVNNGVSVAAGAVAVLVLVVGGFQLALSRNVRRERAQERRQDSRLKGEVS